MYTPAATGTAAAQLCLASIAARRVARAVGQVERCTERAVSGAKQRCIYSLADNSCRASYGALAGLQCSVCLAAAELKMEDT